MDREKVEKLVGIYKGQTYLNGTAQDIKMIEQLYGADKEIDALRIIDRILELPEKFDDKLEKLGALQKGTELVVLVPKPSGSTVEMYEKLGGGYLRDLMFLRCKCFSGIAGGQDPDIRKRSMENSEIVLKLFPKDDAMITMAAQVLFANGEEGRAVKLVQEILTRNPKDVAATSTMKIFERRKKGQEGFTAMTERAQKIILAELDKLQRKQQPDNSKAMEAYQLLMDSIKVYDGQPKAWGLISLLHYLNNDQPRAMETLQKAQALNPADDTVRLVTTLVNQKGWLSAGPPPAAPQRTEPVVTVASAGWETAGGNTSRTGVSPTAILPPFAAAWKFDGCKGVQGEIIGSGFVAIFADRENKIYAIDIRNGRKLWDYTMQGRTGTPSTDGSRVFAGDSNCGVCLDLSSGKEIWKKDHPNPAPPSTKPAGCILYEGMVAYCDERTLLRSPKDGKAMLAVDDPFDSQYHTGACADETHIYIPAPKEFVCVEINTGKSRGLKINRKIRSGPVRGGDFLFFGSEDAKIAAVSLDGSRVWEQKIIKESVPLISRPVFDNGMVYIGAPDNSLHAFTQLGKKVWQTSPADKAVRPLVLMNHRDYGGCHALISGNLIFAMTSKVSAIDKLNGTSLWDMELSRSEKAAPPAIIAGRLLIGDYYLEAFKIDETKSRISLQPPQKKKWWKLW